MGNLYSMTDQAAIVLEIEVDPESMSMRCQDCSQLRGYPYKRSHLVAQDFGERSAIDVVDRGSDEAQTGDPHE
jgi:hypothetical protein